MPIASDNRHAGAPQLDLETKSTAKPKFKMADKALSVI
jgi:hypothetical protein